MKTASFMPPQDLEPRAERELSKADRMLAKVKLGEWRPGKSPLQRFEAKLLKAIKDRVDVQQIAAEIGL